MIEMKKLTLDDAVRALENINNLYSSCLDDITVAAHVIKNLDIEQEMIKDARNLYRLLNSAQLRATNMSADQRKMLVLLVRKWMGGCSEAAAEELLHTVALEYKEDLRPREESNDQ